MQFELVGCPARLPIEISRRLEEAISARDPIAAGRAMRVHLTETAARIGLRIGHTASS